MATKSRIALITLATGKYISLVPELYETASKYFFPSHEVAFVLYTDKVKQAEKITTSYHVKIFKIKHEPWPHITLKRYHMISQVECYLRDNFDYLYYIDADMVFCSDVEEEIIGDLVATKHPGFYNKSRGKFIYETNKESKAYIEPKVGKYYFIGAFQGGSTESYLKAVNEMKRNIDKDLEKGIIAVWHDESHWNRYCASHKPDVVLSPSYSYAEICGNAFEKKIAGVHKSNEHMRYPLIQRQLRKVRQHSSRIKHLIARTKRN